MAKQSTHWAPDNSGTGSPDGAGGSLLLENGGHLLLENGGRLLLEDVTITPKQPTIWSDS